MVDTTDSKSVASNRVRVQVSSPVYGEALRNQSLFYLTITALEEALSIVCGTLLLRSCVLE